MTCPKCNNPWACPCAACTDRRGTPSNWTWHVDGMQTCGKCGFAAHEDLWTERDFEASQRAAVSEWTPREQWPQWLQDADTRDARVQVLDGTVHWHDGVWRDGVWHDGTWHGGGWHDGVWRGGGWLGGEWLGGEWHGGVWRDGVWHGGVWHGGGWYGGWWHGGTWRGGTWHGGTWRGGDWYGGVWRDGVWHGGRSSVRSKYIPVWDGSRIHIGCKAGTIPEWDEWFAGAEQYETPRDTDAFRLIHAHYQAIRTWVVEMGWHGEAAQ